MPTETPAQVSAGSIDTVLARCGAKDRANIEKHLALADGEASPAHGKLWRRLAGKLAELAPMAVTTAGAGVALFFIADGKYRMQVFALEDRNDGVISLYLADVLDQAVAAKLIHKAAGGFVYGGASKHPLDVQTIDAANTPDPASHVKHMIGWKRKAMKLTLPTAEAESPLVKLAESLCTLAAKQWAAKA